MKMPAFSSKPLALAVVAALATSSPVMAHSLDRPRDSTIATDALTAIVAFGDHSDPLPHDTKPSSASAIPVVRPVEVDRLAPEASRHFLAMVDATSLPLAADQAATLRRLFDQGSPVLVHMDARTPEDLAHVSELFGIAPTSGDMIVRNDGDAIEVFAASPESDADTSALIHALVESVEPVPSADVPFARFQNVPDVEADDPDSAGVDPGLHIDVNLVDTRGEIAGVTRVDLVRSRTLSSDFKLITLTSSLTVNPTNKGVSDGSTTGKNAWTADLPLEYRFRHTLTRRIPM